MKVLFVASEALPFMASGGLGDVAGSLPAALRKRLIGCRVVMPLYDSIPQELKDQMQFITSISVPVAWRRQYCGIFEAKHNGVIYYLLDNQYYFKRDGIYGHYDDAERFAFFARAVLEIIPAIDWKPDIIHCNDWQSALTPLYYSCYYANRMGYENIKTVFTIHNIQYQGRYGMEILEDVLGIPKHFASLMEYDRDINLMKAAIEVADKVTTVSPTYSKEILDPWFSHGLDRALSDKQYKTCGFLNGIDTDMYNPATDPSIPANFTVSKKAGKKICTQKLLEEVGLPQGDEPVLGMVSRLVEHKGFDLVKCVFDDIINLGYKVVILGSGEAQYEQFFHEMRWKYPDRVAFTCGYIPDLAKKIYAGANMFLMPSKSEPCGLAQMISLRYGTIPIVRKTGGLADSIVDCGDENGTGYTFQSYNAHDMLYAVKRAKDCYWNKTEWNKLVTRAMKADFSWKQSAKLYIGLYKELVGEQ